MEHLDFLLDVRVASFLIGIFIPIIFYWYSTRNYNYWKKKGIPYAKPYPIIGSTVLKRRFEDVEVERYKKYGRIYGFFEANKAGLYIGEPELLKNILVKDFQYFTTRRIIDFGDPILNNILSMLRGEDWKRVRTIVSPTFSTGKIKRVMSIFEDCAQTLIQNCKTISKGQGSVDMTKLYGGFTMDVIASSAFSTKLDSHNDPQNEFVTKAKNAFQRNLGVKFVLALLMPKITKFIGIRPFNLDNWMFFKRATLEIIETRRRTGQIRNDFLQLLLDTAKELPEEEMPEEKSDDIVTNYGDESVNHPVFKNTSTKTLSIDELISQCVIFFLAGYHTTSITLTLATYQLALNEDVQDKVFKEIREILEENNGKLIYESIPKMKYLDNVISETLRMYPPAIFLDRTADADYKLGDTGIKIPKGMPIKIPVFAMHRDPKLFPEPEKFIPDRFTQEGRINQIPYSYLPFGAGPRNCVGMRFALMELKVCLIYVLSTFKVKTCSKTKIPIEFGKGAGLLTPVEATLALELRSDCPLKS